MILGSCQSDTFKEDYKSKTDADVYTNEDFYAGGSRNSSVPVVINFKDINNFTNKKLDKIVEESTEENGE